MHKHVKTLEFHQIDGTQNEIHGITILSYPTIFLFRAFDKNDPITYKGQRTSSAMSNWLREQSGMRFSMPNEKEL
jgi:hypothetical protein